MRCIFRSLGFQGRELPLRLLLGVSILAVACFPLPAAEVERDKYDEIVDRFIEYDIGKLRGEAGARANQAFQALNDQKAIPALVRGVNKAARLQASCPIMVVSAKLNSLLANADRRTLQGAMENLDSSGEGVFYASYVDSLIESAARTLNVVPPGGERVIRGGGTISQLRRAKKAPAAWSREDLVEAAAEEEGVVLVSALEQLRDRKGREYTAAFAQAIDALEEEQKQLARGLFSQRLMRLTERELTLKLKDPHPEVRLAAARAVGYKGAPLCVELAQAVADKDPLVAAEAHAALAKLAGEDLGPQAGAPYAEWFTASKRWEEWLREREESQE